jgi:hypothetical protein
MRLLLLGGVVVSFLDSLPKTHGEILILKKNHKNPKKKLKIKNQKLKKFSFPSGATVCVDALTGRITSADAGMANLVGSGILGAPIWTVLPATEADSDDDDENDVDPRGNRRPARRADHEITYLPLEAGGPHFVQVVSKKRVVTEVRAFRGTVQVGPRACTRCSRQAPCP